MGKIRVGEEREFNYIGKESWYIVIKENLEKEYFNSPLNLYVVVKEAIEKKEKILVLGIWHGQWRTDAFELEPKKLLKVLKPFLKEWGFKKKTIISEPKISKELE